MKCKTENDWITLELQDKTNEISQTCVKKEQLQSKPFVLKRMDFFYI